MKKAEVDAQIKQLKGSVKETLDTQLGSLYQELSHLQLTPILKGDYDLKLLRQEYFLSKQRKLHSLLQQQFFRNSLAQGVLELAEERQDSLVTAAEAMAKSFDEQSNLLFVLLVRPQVIECGSFLGRSHMKRMAAMEIAEEHRGLAASQAIAGRKTADPEDRISKLLMEHLDSSVEFARQTAAGLGREAFIAVEQAVDGEAVWSASQSNSFISFQTMSNQAATLQGLMQGLDKAETGLSTQFTELFKERSGWIEKLKNATFANSSTQDCLSPKVRVAVKIRISDPFQLQLICVAFRPWWTRLPLWKVKWRRWHCH